LRRGPRVARLLAFGASGALIFVGWLLKTKELENFGEESNEHFGGSAA